MRVRIDFDHDADVAVRTAVAARHRAEHSRRGHAARTEITFGSTQGFKGFATVHAAEHSTKSPWAGEIGAVGGSAAAGGAGDPAQLSPHKIVPPISLRIE